MTAIIHGKGKEEMTGLFCFVLMTIWLSQDELGRGKSVAKLATPSVLLSLFGGGSQPFNLLPKRRNVWPICRLAPILQKPAIYCLGLKNRQLKSTEEPWTIMYNFGITSTKYFQGRKEEAI